MKRKNFLLITLVFSILFGGSFVSAQNWTKTFGKYSYEGGSDVKITPDGSFILTGGTSSYGASGFEIWLIKTDAFGNEEWRQLYGELYYESGQSVDLASDGGYIIAGSSTSYDYPYNEGYWTDIIVVKTDPNGYEEWRNVYVDTCYDNGNFVQTTKDGGFIVVGESCILGYCAYDIDLIKISASGEHEWYERFRGWNDYYYGFNDEGKAVQQTSDLGYIIVGSTNGSDDYWGDDNIWLIKTDQDGCEDWNRYIGGDAADKGYSIKITEDDGFIITGYTYSYGAGLSDLWLVKTDNNGYVEWNQVFGGSGFDEGYSVQQTEDGGFIVVGRTNSLEIKKKPNYKNLPDFEKNILQNTSKTTKKCPLEFYDQDKLISSFQELSKNNQDSGICYLSQLSSKKESEQVFGKKCCRFKNKKCQTDTKSQNNLISSDYEDYDIWLIKTDSLGNQEWSKTFGGTDNDYAYSVQQTADGGFIIVGSTYSYGAGKDDLWLLYYHPNNENNPPYAATLIKPKDNSIVIPGSVTFAWNNNGDPDGDYVYSRLVYRKIGSSKWHQIDLQDQKSYVAELPANTYLEWKICSYDPLQNSDPCFTCTDPWRIYVLNK